MAQTRFDRGVRIRKEVLGLEYVESQLSSAKADRFSAPIQKLVTEFGWGDIWSRPGLDRKTRSLVNIALLVSMNRQNELEVHIRGAIRNGVTTLQLQELLIHTAAYCGFPAALDGFRTAKKTLERMTSRAPKSKPAKKIVSSLRKERSE
jgi:4-carboxymuconolactone decarboxylase